MQIQADTKLTEPRNKYPDMLAVELEQQQKRQEILKWISENAAEKLRNAWSR